LYLPYFTMPAKIHRITHRHHEEVKLNLYARRLDKIYAELGKSPMLPKVVKKMREEYTQDPHALYVKVCQKYGKTPEDEIDAYRLVYGKTQFDKHDYKFHKKEHEMEVKESKEVVREIKEEEPPTPEDSEEEESEEEEEEEDEPEKPKESKYTFKMPERKEKRSSPRYDFDSSRYERSSPRASPRNNRGSFRVNLRESPRYQSRPRVDVGSSARQVLDSPRVGSPRALYRHNSKRNVEQLDYVNVNVGDIVETMVLTGKSGNQESGFWIPARILSIDEKRENMNLQVLQPKKYGLAAKAVDVPYRYVRCPVTVTWQR